MHPILFQNNDLIIYSYPLFMGLGWGVAYQLFFGKVGTSFPKLKSQILFWGIFISAWLGAKILFVMTYPKQEMLELNASFWTGGGFVFYGGLIGAVIFLGVYKFLDRQFNINVLWSMLPALALGHAIGRIGCFLAGCCFGKPTDFFWGVMLHGHYRHPTQLIEACGLLLIGCYLLKSSAPKYQVVCRYLMAYGFLRLLVESLRGDAVRGNWGHLTPSQWISLSLILVSLLMVFLPKISSLSPSK